MKSPKVKDSVESQIENDEIVETLFRDRMKYLSLLSSAVVYELHTPLVIIRGLAESLLRGPDQDPTANLKQISYESKNLLKVLEAMTFVSSSVGPLKMQNLSLAGVVEQVTVFFNQTCLERKISFNVQIDDHLRIESEPNRLKSVLIALISNAVESFNNSPQQGVKNITVYACSDKEGISLSISDSGMGVCPLVQDRILKGLYLNIQNMQKESGLGLALAQKMATDLHIELSFVSENSKGTTFTLKFPKNAFLVP